MGSQAPGTSLHSQPHSHNHVGNNSSAKQVITKNPVAMAQESSLSKTALASAYPSPVDEVRHSVTPSSPAQPIHNALPRDAEKSLPSIREFLQRPMSPSTSPHMPPQPYVASPGSLPLPVPTRRISSGDPLADNFTDPELFPDGTVAVPTRQQPLFPLPSFATPRGRTSSQSLTWGPPRRRKRTPHQTPLPHPLEPARLPVTMNMLYRADPAQWFEDRMRENAELWPSEHGRRQGGGIDMSRTSSSQSGYAATSTPANNKRKLSRQDSGPQGPSTKRARVPRGEGHTITRSSPREAMSSFFDTVLDKAPDSVMRPSKPVVKRAVTPAAPIAKKVKAHAEEADVAYNLYDDTCPDVSTLDKGLKFTASWSGKPLNLDNDPNRGLLHPEEIRLASKLALTCARYLYLKRRFYAGRLDFARKSQLYNINAAQQQCKGQDVHGVVGADVNKTSSMWKAFNSVGWLEAAHMKPYL